MNKPDFFPIIALSCLITLFYCLLTIRGAGDGLVNFKRMVELSALQVDVPLDIVPSRYLLKLKYQAKDGREIKVFINGHELVPFKIKRKKVIETHYFYIEPPAIEGENKLTVAFIPDYPPDIDVRLNNHVIVPSENFSYDLMVLFRGSGLRKPVSMPAALLVFAACLVFFMMMKRLPCVICAVPFISAASLFAVHNLLPLGPYQVFVSPFLFFAAFILSFSLLAAARVPMRVTE